MCLMIFRILFCTLASLIPFQMEAKIIETRTIENILPLIDKDTWLLVDLDNTTFEGKQALGHTKWFYDKAHKKMKDGLTLEEATKECYPEWIEVQKVCPVNPVEAAFIPELNLLQQQGIIVMGLTHRQPSLVESTLRQVNSLGLNFFDSAPVKDSFIVPSETPTKYVQGILFTEEYNKKGEIFVRFLSIIDQKPKKVVFIDDKKSHVEEMERALTGIGIGYIGVHYTAIEHAEKVYSPEIAEFQYKISNKILSNEGALLLMQHDQE